MPPRHTKDTAFLVLHERFSDAEAALTANGWAKSRRLVFPNAKLGLHGGAWHHGQTGDQPDLIASSQRWAAAAFDAPIARDQNGARILPLPYLVMRKIDSARTTDQGDLSRMPGRLDDKALCAIIEAAEQNYDDPQVADDIRQYAEIGRWEYSTESQNPIDDAP